MEFEHRNGQLVAVLPVLEVYLRRAVELCIAIDESGVRVLATFIAAAVEVCRQFSAMETLSIVPRLAPKRTRDVWPTTSSATRKGARETVSAGVRVDFHVP